VNNKSRKKRERKEDQVNNESRNKKRKKRGRRAQGDTGDTFGQSTRVSVDGLTKDSLGKPHRLRERERGRRRLEKRKAKKIEKQQVKGGGADLTSRRGTEEITRSSTIASHRHRSVFPAFPFFNPHHWPQERGEKDCQRWIWPSRSSGDKAEAQNSDGPCGR
jgi:hypothetical protein